MHWLLTNWELVVPLLAAALVLVFDVVYYARGKEPPLRAYLAVVLIVVGSISITLISQDRPEILHLASHLKLDYASGNPYVEELIDDNLTDLKDSLEKRSFETKSLDSTVEELLRAIKHTEAEDSVNATDYGIPWAREFKDYQQENLKAIDRGVHITRVFIIPASILTDEEKAGALWESIRAQKLKGIDVKFVKEAQLIHYHGYQSHQHGMVEFRFGGKSRLLMIEAVRYWEAIERQEPPRLVVEWDPQAAKSEDDYFAWLILRPEVADVNPKAARPF